MRALLGFSFFVFFNASAFAESLPDWPQFRGPLGNGVADAEDLPVKFGESDALVWKTKLPGRGWSSPVSRNGKIWLTTAAEIVPSEEERIKLLTEAGDDPKKFKVRQIMSSIMIGIQVIDWKTGKLEKEIELKKIDAPDSIHSLNSYASPTPVLDGGKLYAHFGTFGTWCVDTENGEVVWQTRLPLEHSVGPGSSPFIYEDKLILICDGVDQQYVTALDKNSGKEIWKTDRPAMRAPTGDQKKAYNTPIVIQAKGQENKQLICMGSQWLVSYDPDSGKENWRLDHGKGFSVVPRPVFSEEHQLIYISTGFGKPELWAVRPDGKGDITEQEDMVAWKDPKRIPARPSPLLLGDELYVLTEGGIATCFDAATGTVHWTERVGGNYSASPLFANGRIYLFSEEGKSTVLKPGKEYSIDSENQLNEGVMASPLASDANLLVRGKESLYRFRK